MRRLFWVAVGAAAGVYAVRKVQKTLHAYSPSGLAERAGGVTDSVKAFAEDVRSRAADREAELREALGLVDDGTAPDLTPAGAADLLEHPAQPRRTPRTSSPRRGTG